jgi:trans-2,3-dihydro-3-hydroxyanthranilate isomerase
MERRMKSYPYQVVDVFTNQRFGGNPLAVITDARGLDDEQMLQIAREFNFSESTFVLPPQDAQHTAQVRIFTPGGEMPFAGHPNVGTAYVLAQLGELFGKPIGQSLVFEELAGLVPIELYQHEGSLWSSITAPQPLSIGSQVPVADIAAALGLEPQDVVTQVHAPVFASVGFAFLFVQLTNRQVLARANAHVAKLRELLEQYHDDTTDFSVFLYYRPTPDLLSARMFAPLNGIAEDPATGSAAGTLGALLAYYDERSDLDFRLQIDQGVDMGRPSTILVQVEKQDGQLGAVRISGSSVLVMRGELLV